MSSTFRTLGVVVCLVFVLCFAAPNARADDIEIFNLHGTPPDSPLGVFEIDLTTQSYIPGSSNFFNGSIIGTLDFTGSTIMYLGNFLAAPVKLDFSGSCPGGFDTCASQGSFSGGPNTSFDLSNPSVAAATAAALGVLTPMPTFISGQFDDSLISTSVSVPEPGTMLLLVTGLIGIAGAVRRRLAG